MRIAGVAAIVGCALALIAVPQTSHAVEPPNQNDPCSSAGRNTCGTHGRRLPPRRTATACAGSATSAASSRARRTRSASTSRYWYPSPSYRFREVSGPLRNREGETVSAREPAADGVRDLGVRPQPRTRPAGGGDALRPLADGRRAPGRGRPRPRSAHAVESTLRAHRPRRSAPTTAPIGSRSAIPSGARRSARGRTATIRVLSGPGNGVPNLELALTARGAGGIPTSVRTNAEGLARVTFTPTTAGERPPVRRERETLASTLPRVFAPTTSARPRATASGSSCRDSQTVRAEDEGDGRAGAGSRSPPGDAEPRSSSASRVPGPSHDQRRRLKLARQCGGADLTAPSATEEAIRCDRPACLGGHRRPDRTGDVHDGCRPVERGRVVRRTSRSFPATRTTSAHDALPRDPNESFRVETQPRVQTIVSATRVQPGHSHPRPRDGQRPRRASASRSRPSSTAPSPPRGDRVHWHARLDGTLEVDRDGEYRTAPLHRHGAGLLHVRRERSPRADSSGRAETRMRRGGGDDGRRRKPAGARRR